MFPSRSSFGGEAHGATESRGSAGMGHGFGTTTKPPADDLASLLGDDIFDVAIGDSTHSDPLVGLGGHNWGPTTGDSLLFDVGGHHTQAGGASGATGGFSGGRSTLMQQQHSVHAMPRFMTQSMPDLSLMAQLRNRNAAFPSLSSAHSPGGHSFDGRAGSVGTYDFGNATPDYDDDEDDFDDDDEDFYAAQMTPEGLKSDLLDFDSL